MTPTEALAYLAGQPGFADQVDADGVLWTHGQKVGIRVAATCFELVMGPGLSALERAVLANRAQCPAEAGTVFAVHTYHRHVLGRIAYAALHSAFSGEAGHYLEHLPQPAHPEDEEDDDEARIGPSFEGQGVGCCDLYGTPHSACRYAP